ncbi:MAG: hypothetical protein IKM51_00045 [Oscillospiraceae bacterium]|nr:hypothetical protein [Oscillospiraceae bacterium]
MDLVKKYLLHLPQGNVMMTKEEVFAEVAKILENHPSEHICAYRVWYEGFEGCGRPATDLKECIDEAIAALPQWKNIGPMRFEKFGVVNPSFQNMDYANAPKDKNGDPMVLHQYHIGKHYQGPDGRIFWIAVIEVFDMRCFEWKDGKYIGQMVEIDPFSDYARQMVEVKV